MQLHLTKVYWASEKSVCELICISCCILTIYICKYLFHCQQNMLYSACSKLDIITMSLFDMFSPQKLKYKIKKFPRFLFGARTVWHKISRFAKEQFRGGVGRKLPLSWPLTGGVRNHTSRSLRTTFAAGWYLDRTEVNCLAPSNPVTAGIGFDILMKSPDIIPVKLPWIFPGALF